MKLKDIQKNVVFGKSYIAIKIVENKNKNTISITHYYGNGKMYCRIHPKTYSAIINHYKCVKGCSYKSDKGDMTNYIIWEKKERIKKILAELDIENLQDYSSYKIAKEIILNSNIPVVSIFDLYNIVASIATKLNLTHCDSAWDEYMNNPYYNDGIDKDDFDGYDDLQDC